MKKTKDINILENKKINSQWTREPGRISKRQIWREKSWKRKQKPKENTQEEAINSGSPPRALLRGGECWAQKGPWGRTWRNEAGIGIAKLLDFFTAMRTVTEPLGGWMSRAPGSCNVQQGAAVLVKIGHQSTPLRRTLSLSLTPLNTGFSPKLLHKQKWQTVWQNLHYQHEHRHRISKYSRKANTKRGGLWSQQIVALTCKETVVQQESAKRCRTYQSIQLIL